MCGLSGMLCYSALYHSKHSPMRASLTEKPLREEASELGNKTSGRKGQSVVRTEIYRQVILLLLLFIGLGWAADPEKRKEGVPV